MPTAFQSEVFWSALGALIAFSALLGSAAAGAYALLKAGKRRRLQRVLDREREFYDKHARRVVPAPTGPLQQSAADQYIRGIREGLVRIGKLDEKQRGASKDRLRQLLDQLRATHKTLVEALKPFTTDDATVFFEKFDTFNQNFGAIYHSGNIPHDARTHCGDVVEIVNELATQLAQDDQWHPIRNIASLMQSADEGIIVPVMQDILARTEVELSLISSAIRDKAFEKRSGLRNVIVLM